MFYKENLSDTKNISNVFYEVIFAIYVLSNFVVSYFLCYLEKIVFSKFKLIFHSHTNKKTMS